MAHSQDYLSAHAHLTAGLSIDGQDSLKSSLDFPLTQGQKQILLYEFQTSAQYVTRLSFAYDHLTRFEQEIFLRELPRYWQVCCQFLELSPWNQQWNQSHITFKDLADFRQKWKGWIQFVESSITHQDWQLQELSHFADLCNSMYAWCFRVHEQLLHQYGLMVQIPRCWIAEEISGMTQLSEEISPSQEPLNSNSQNHLPQVPKMFIHFQQLQSILIAAEKNVEGGLEAKKKRRYQQFLAEGHQFITKKEFAHALKYFHQALRFEQSAEILTLIGWCHHLLQQDELAKSFCLKAIKADAEYGPAYNDLGSYLLSEGLVRESLLWFEKAKKARIYHNREYPYINSGRAYLQLRETKKALEEFRNALVFAPDHQEIPKAIDLLLKDLLPTNYLEKKEIPAIEKSREEFNKKQLDSTIKKKLKHLSLLSVTEEQGHSLQQQELSTEKKSLSQARLTLILGGNEESIDGMNSF